MNPQRKDFTTEDVRIVWRQLAEWLICMDDIEDAYGSAERRTVTLTKIIDRAKLALRGEVPS